MRVWDHPPEQGPREESHFANEHGTLWGYAPALELMAKGVQKVLKQGNIPSTQCFFPRHSIQEHRGISCWGKQEFFPVGPNAFVQG